MNIADVWIKNDLKDLLIFLNYDNTYFIHSTASIETYLMFIYLSYANHTKWCSRNIKKAMAFKDKKKYIVSFSDTVNDNAE